MSNRLLHLPTVIGPSLQLFAAGADVAGDLPERLLICKWGRNEVDGGKQVFVVNAATVRSMGVNQVAPWDEVCLDFDHATEDPKVPHPKPIAAYGKPICVPGEGVYLSALRWTPAGEAAYRAKSYADLSPAILHDPKTGSVLFFKSCALTPNGRITGLHVNYSATLTITQTESMDFKKLLIGLLINLGVTAITDASTDEEIAAAVEKAGTEEKQEPGEPVTTLSAKKDDPLTLLAARLDAMETKAATNARQSAINAATAQGKNVFKMFSAKELDTLPEVALYSYLDKLPAGEVVTTSKTGHAQPGKTLDQLESSDEVALAKLYCGDLDPADVEKYAGIKLPA